MEAGKVKLGYWAIRGFGQPNRYILELAGVDYTEERYGMETSDVWFKEHKPALKSDFANLPYI